MTPLAPAAFILGTVTGFLAGFATGLAGALWVMTGIDDAVKLPGKKDPWLAELAEIDASLERIARTAPPTVRKPQ